MVLAVTSAASDTLNCRLALPPAGAIPQNVPTVKAFQRPTQATVEPAGTSNADAGVKTLLRPDAAAPVTALRAYAGEPPVSSLVPVVL